MWVRNLFNNINVCTTTLGLIKIEINENNVKFANFVYFYITREKVLPNVTTFPHSGNAFPCVIQKYTKFANFTGQFRMLIPAVLIDFPNSKVCLIGRWSIFF